MKRCLVVALVGLAISFAFPTFAQQQKSLKELIVGTWLLDSVYDQTQAESGKAVVVVGGYYQGKLRFQKHRGLNRVAVEQFSLSRVCANTCSFTSKNS